MFFERNSIATTAAIATQLINDLQAAGFVLKYVNAGTTSDVSPNITATIAVLESGSAVDPLYATQPWRVQVDGSGTTAIYMYLGTAAQLPDGGTKVSGFLSTGLTTASGALPWSYKLAVTNHGFAVLMGQASGGVGLGNVICCQRLVSHNDATVLTSAHSPVFLFYLNPSTPAVQAGVIREDDILVPQALTNVGSSGSRSLLAWNTGSTQGPAVDSNGNYVLQNISGLATSRAVYLEEMDLIMFAPAVAFATGQDVSFTTYGQSRTYLSTLPYSGSTSFRVFILHKINGVVI